jgi:ubiquinone/menaquinone biosynthesis C-methylase UbiE
MTVEPIREVITLDYQERSIRQAMHIALWLTLFEERIKNGNIPAHYHLLDAGCGCGSLQLGIERLKNDNNRLDIRTTGINLEEKTLPISMQGCRFMQGDLTQLSNLKIDSLSFNEVISLNTLHWLTKTGVHSFLRDLHQFIRNDGKIEIVVKAGDGIFLQALRKVCESDEFESYFPNHGILPLNQMTKANWQEALANNGYENIDIRTTKVFEAGLHQDARDGMIASGSVLHFLPVDVDLEIKEEFNIQLVDSILFIAAQDNQLAWNYRITATKRD